LAVLKKLNAKGLTLNAVSEIRASCKKVGHLKNAGKALGSKRCAFSVPKRVPLGRLDQKSAILSGRKRVTVQNRGTPDQF
jgi:hypothetical protein